MAQADKVEKDTQKKAGCRAVVSLDAGAHKSTHLAKAARPPFQQVDSVRPCWEVPSLE